MTSALRTGLAIAFLAATPCGATAASDSPPSVLEVSRSLKDGGGYYWQSGSGSPRTIEFDGQTILEKQDKGTYCSGFTFAVVMQASADRDLLRGKSIDEVRRFQKEWYGVPKDAAEKQCAVAVERLGVGREIKKLAAARPGDFVQIWRTNKSGHSVVLVDWVRENRQIVGLRYRSSQKSTDGIGERTEYFSDVPDKRGQVLRERTYVARLHDAPR